MSSPPNSRVFRIGTRTSQLARIQTDLFVDALRTRQPDARLEVVGLSTRGDQDKVTAIPNLGQGAFVKELEVALISDDIDIAVHSLKDLPTELPPGLFLAAILPREDPRDALVSRERLPLAKLPAGARVGTGSPRRAAQVLALRPDLKIVLLRGNVDTRIRKVMEDGEAEAAVLAASGLIRMGLSHLITEYLEPNVMLPAVGQGFLAIECREDDAETRALVALTEDADARRAAEVERAFLAAVGGFCKTPLAGYATVTEDGRLSVEVLVASLDGTRLIRERLQTPVDAPAQETGDRLKQAVFAQGAEAVIAQEEGLLN